MKVVAFNGSPRKNGNTFHSLKTVLDELEKEGIETEIVNVGGKTIKGCMGCGQCAKNRDEKCIYDKDDVNKWIQKMKEADGVILSSPVYFSAIGGTMKCFLDRAFMVTGVNDYMLRHKVGASVIAVRRSGGVPAFDQLNNYLNCSEMVLPSSNYWNVAYGLRPGDVNEDEEGKQIMRVLGKNMAWILKLIEHGKNAVKPPEQERKKYMNFIR